jgi:hypothetical protein
VVLVSLVFRFVFSGGERLVFFGPLLRAAEIHGFKRHFMR